MRLKFKQVTKVNHPGIEALNTILVDDKGRTIMTTIFRDKSPILYYDLLRAVQDNTLDEISIYGDIIKKEQPIGVIKETKDCTYSHATELSFNFSLN